MDVWGGLLVSFFGDFGGYGEIVKIELSRESELNLEGWRGSEIG